MLHLIHSKMYVFFFFFKSVLNPRSVLSFRCTSSLVLSQKYWKRKWHFSGNSSHCCLLYILSQFHVWTVTIRSSVPHGQHEFIPLMYRWRTVVLSVQCMFWLVLTDWNFMKARWLLLNSVYMRNWLCSWQTPERSLLRVQHGGFNKWRWDKGTLYFPYLHLNAPIKTEHGFWYTTPCCKSKESDNGVLCFNKNVNSLHIYIGQSHQ